MICVGCSVPETQIPRWLLRDSMKRKLESSVERVSKLPAKSESGGSGKTLGMSRTMVLMSEASELVRVLFSFHALRSIMLLINGMLLLLLLPFRRRTIEVLAEEKADASLVWLRGVEEKKESVAVRVPLVMVPRRSRESEAAVRRAMSIRRIGVSEEGDDGRSVRDFALLSTSRGDTLFTQSWTSVSIRTKGILVLLHGLNEHGGRYNIFARQLNENGLKVYAMDWIGHGGSDGLHGYVHSLDYAVNDLKVFLNKVLAENPGLPCFCFGHSTGGAIVLKAVAPIFSLLIPRYQFSGANKAGPPVCRDLAALKAKYSDPLVFTGSVRVRTGYEILRICHHLQHNLNRVTVPFLVLHGTADTVTDPAASNMLYQGAKSADKSIKLYDGFLHDLLFEPEREEITADIIVWLASRLSQQS